MSLARSKPSVEAEDPAASPPAVSQSRTLKVLILSSGQTLTSLVGIVSAVILARLFTQHDFATYRQTMLAYAFASPFAMFGLDQALYWIMPTEKRRPRGVLTENLLLLFVAGGLLTLFLLAGGNELLARRFNNPDLARCLLLLAPYPLLILPTSSLGACLMARDRTGQVAGYNVSSRLCLFLALVIAILSSPTPESAVVGTVVGAGVTGVAAVVLMWRACSGGDWRPTWSGMQQQLVFAIPLGLASVVGAVAITLDQVLVSAMCSTEDFAVYSLGTIQIPLVGILTGSITSVVMVDYARFFSEGRPDEVVRLIHRAVLKSGLLIIPMMFFLLCIAPELMRFLFGPDYEGSAAPFRLRLLVLPIQTITFGAVLRAVGASRHILYQELLNLLVFAPMCWLGVHFFGFLGAAMAWVVVRYSLVVPYMVWAISGALRMSPRLLFPWWDLAKLFGASSAAALASLCVKLFPGLGDLGTLVVAIVLFAAAFVPIASAFGVHDLDLLLSRILLRIPRSRKA